MNINTTPVPNAVFDVHLRELKLAELKVLLVIIRHTLGWEDKRTKSERKELDWISNSQLALKTGCSARAINEAIQALVGKQLIDVLSYNGQILDTPEKRRGQQRLLYRPASAIFTLAENVWSKGLHQRISDPANANFAVDLRRKVQELTQNMHITKEILQN